MNLLAQMFRQGQPWGFAEMAIAFVVVIAIVALVALFCRMSGIEIPQWVWQVLAIVVGACVIIAAIRFVAGM